MIIDKYSPSLEEQVYQKLEEDILGAKIEKGTQLTELSLTRKLGVSRTPVRAALHRLAEEGLVSITPNKGAVVIGVSKEDLIATYEVRTRLEGLASRLCSENMSEEELAELAEALELQEFYISRRDTEHLRELDTKFHYIISDRYLKFSVTYTRISKCTESARFPFPADLRNRLKSIEKFTRLSLHTMQRSRTILPQSISAVRWKTY